MDYNPTDVIVFKKEEVTENPKAILVLKNKVENPVAFKVRNTYPKIKTTEPKKFVVKPTMGILKGKEDEIEINIHN